MHKLIAIIIGTLLLAFAASGIRIMVLKRKEEDE